MFVLGLFSVRPFALERVELELLDWRFRVRGPVEPVHPVVIAAIDAKSVDELGRWPWRRSVMAELIDRLYDAGVATIGLDIVFSEPEAPPELLPLRAAREALGEMGSASDMALAIVDQALERADTDGELEAAIERARDKLVLGFFFRTSPDPSLDVAITQDDLSAKLRDVRRGKLKIKGNEFETGQVDFLPCYDVEPNIERFHLASRRMGFFSTEPDDDGAIRRAPLLIQCAGDAYVALDLAIAEMALGRQWAAAYADKRGDMKGVTELRIGELEIPTGENGEVLVNFRGPTGTFPHVSISDIVFGRIPDEELAGKIVIVGPTEVGIQDIYPTPFSEGFPGVEVHANVVDNILSGQVLRRDLGYLVYEFALIVARGLLVTFVAPLFGGPGFGALFVLVLGLAATGANVWLFASQGLWLNLTYPSVTLLLVYLAVGVTQAVTIQAKSRQIRRQFATYVPPEVVEDMTEHPDNFKLGGERREISILFSDIRSFTTISEEIGAENVVRLLDTYLTPMTRIVFESRGTLDKYIGDAVVAFWGAPLDVPEHWLRACEAAVDMQAEIRRLRKERGDVPGMNRLRAGIGIHTGMVAVGNMGSELRFDYTMAGDGVNLCARIESLTKKYGAEILASSDLVERLPSGFLYRDIDLIRVKGRHEAVRLFEVLGRREATPEEKTWLEAFAAGREAYTEGRWEQAVRCFDEARGARGEPDLACELLLERIARLRDDPPDDWDGIYTFEEK